MRQLPSNVHGHVPHTIRTQWWSGKPRVIARIVFALCPFLWGSPARPWQDPVAPPAVRQAPATDVRYVLGPGDQVSIWALGMTESFEKPFRVDQSGYVDLPMIGRVRASDRTVEEFKADLMGNLRNYVNDPQVAVTVVETRSQPVSILGAVNNPGVHQLQGRKTLLEMLSVAGGLRADAGKSVKISRAPAPDHLPPDPNSGAEEVIDVSVKDLLEGKGASQNIAIRPHDVITVPRAEMVYVVGEVHKAGGFMLSERETMSALQALSLAGGLSPAAAPGHARILRRNEGSEERAEVLLDLKGILSSKANDVPLYSGDILFVPNSAVKAAGRRAVETALQLVVGVAIFRR